MAPEPDRLTSDARRRPVLAMALLLFLALVFAALGIWQLKRLAWKEALIARVEQRIHASPVAVPDDEAARGQALTDSEYLRVHAAGRYVASGTALVRAVSDLGSGYWVMTPLRVADGRLIYINRGFVPVGSTLEKARQETPSGAVAVTGLLRLAEPGGGFLRANDPGADRWYSRDVKALAEARGLTHVAPLFIDAQSTAPAERTGGPVPGLTVVRFPNNHLSYALTWFAMMALSLGAALWLRRRGSAA